VKLLALNAGSSTLKYAAFGGAPAPAEFRGHIDLSRAESFEDGRAGPERLGHEGVPGIADACAVAFACIERRDAVAPDVVAHRVVHGGLRFREAVRIDEGVREALAALAPLAPLHQPASLAAIDAARQRWPRAQHVACFDTAFHRDWPDAARRFALPRDLHEDGVRRYGFHGLAHKHAARTLRETCPGARRAVVAHLGSGASLCALADFSSVDCSMGFSALDGLPMATRCGALDPGVLLYLVRERGLDAAALEQLLYRESGLLGASGISGDLRELLASPRVEAHQAVALFVQRVVAGIGAFAATLGGLDALAFSGGVGENAAPVRAAICARLGFLGVQLDAGANLAHAQRLDARDSTVALRRIACDEESVMADEALSVAMS
jgi:acetate kinase